MYDILLINPPLVNYDIKNKPKVFVNTSFFPPINLAYLSSFLENYGFSTHIIDMDAEKFGLSSIPKIIKYYKPKVIGIGITSDVIYPISYEIVKKIKQVKNLPIIVGGLFPTNNPEFLMKKPQIDFLIRGEGEQTLLELMNFLIYNKGDLSKIKGLSFRKNGLIIHNPERELIKNLDEIPFPAWEKFDTKKYYTSISYKNPSFGITASRGCPYRCIFCATSVYKYYRIRSPKNVVDEIEWLIRNKNIKDITFHDPTFNISSKWVIEFCKELLKRKINIKWRCLCRVDNINEKMVAYMKSAGCYCIAFGIETSQDKFLEFLQKDFTIAQVLKAIKIIKKYKIELLAYFMYGIPGQKILDLERDIKFIKKINPDYVNVLILNPATGTKLYNLAKEKGWLNQYNIETFNSPEKVGIQKQLWKIPYLTEKILNYYIRKTYLLYFINIKTFFKYSSKYMKNPFRLLNSIKNSIHRFMY
ncbi:MAG: B12-binding domain-containing radical SAM protein [Promethearchaeia archaeon]